MIPKTYPHLVGVRNQVGSGAYGAPVAEKSQPHPLSAHVKPPAVVLLTARGNQYVERGLQKLTSSGCIRVRLVRAALRRSVSAI